MNVNPGDLVSASKKHVKPLGGRVALWREPAALSHNFSGCISSKSIGICVGSLPRRGRSGKYDADYALVACDGGVGYVNCAWIERVPL